MKNLRHRSLQMAFKYMCIKFCELCSINNWNNPIQKVLLKITIFEFLCRVCLFFIGHINIFKIIG